MNHPRVEAGLGLAPLSPAFYSQRAQAGIFAPPFTHALSLEFQRAPAWDPHHSARVLRGLAHNVRCPQLIVGLSTTTAQALGTAPPGLHDLLPLGQAPRAFVATQDDLWVLVPGASYGQAYDSAQSVVAALAPNFRALRATPLFRYRDGLDLTGFHDGTENPQGAAALAAALIAAAPHAGGSFALVQRYVHRHEAFHALPPDHQSLVIGRERETDVEIAAAPLSAHVKRTAQESYDPEAFLWRRSMPWGTPLSHGLLFIAFMADLSRADRMLRRMAGLEDGVTDALLDYTQNETGAYYYCPPSNAEGLDLALNCP